MAPAAGRWTTGSERVGPASGAERKNIREMLPVDSTPRRANPDAGNALNLIRSGQRNNSEVDAAGILRGVHGPFRVNAERAGGG